MLRLVDSVLSSHLRLSYCIIYPYVRRLGLIAALMGCRCYSSTLFPSYGSYIWPDSVAQSAARVAAIMKQYV